MPRDRSWHVPYVWTYHSPRPREVLHVVFLQRMTDVERQQVIQGLEENDDNAIRQLDVFQPPAPRALKIKKWIRDYSPSSATVWEIANGDAFAKAGQDDAEAGHSSVIFVDSGWEVGNVIAAHWEREGEGEGAGWKLAAARVPMGVANVLLSACDRMEGTTMRHVLGQEAYERSNVDFQKDLPEEGRREEIKQREEYAWPSHLPNDLMLDRSKPAIISLRALDDSAIRALKREIDKGADASSGDVEVLNWEGSEIADRLLIADLYQQMRRRTPGLEPDQKAYAFFVDYLMQGPNGEPRIIAVSETKTSTTKKKTELLPVFTTSFLTAYDKALRGEDLDEENELIDIWKREHVYDFHSDYFEHSLDACPVFYLRPFTQDEERRAHAAICAQGEVERDEDWGHLFAFHGYIFPDDGQSHTLKDLRNLWERCDPFSPAYDPMNPGLYHLSSYPNNFVVADDAVFDPAKPRVWMCSSLDFSGEDTSDQLGWTVGRVDACEASITFVNLDIGNMGPEECFDEETVDRLWLSDLRAYREEDFEREDGEARGLF